MKLSGIAVAAALLAAGIPASAQDRTEPVPDALKRAGVEEKLDAPLPLQLPFKDDAGRDVTLGTYFREGHPVLLTLNYYRCPMLCNLELNGLVEGLKGLGWTPGDEFEIVTVSIDPREGPTIARAKKQTYLEDYGKPGADRGWHFLTGSAASIDALAKAVGFSYEYDADQDQYAHPAVVMLASPEGRLTRYLYGIEFPTSSLKLALVEASKGKIGSAIDRIVLYCYHYDATAGRYSLAAVKLMRVGAVVTILVLAGVVTGLKIQESKRRKAA